MRRTSVVVTLGLMTILFGCSNDPPPSGGPGGAGGMGGVGGAGGMGGIGGAGGAGGVGGACTPVDDGNPCTIDTCEEGSAVHDPAPAGTPCAGSGSWCDGMGTCVQCLAPSDCPDVDELCQTRTCLMGQCGVDFTPAGTAHSLQITGNCQVDLCDGQGGTKSQADDTDLPNDNNPCTDDLCMGGVPLLVDKPEGAPCGANHQCNAFGICVG
ncbi:hypothetical protein [Polyangium sorediatum]|uniref:Lipoprotein n=1 Tax=Polyangium sorediatum TaxID=889274 RepID=A0ABT6PA17_9BACT|nr:hypothetical protein [Polyangium sorediatum]MDI1437388.1 hypothetical protein [Polyangium sorediatum]